MMRGTDMQRRSLLRGLGTIGAVGAGGVVVSGSAGGADGMQTDDHIIGTPVLDWSEAALDAVIETGVIIPDSGWLYVRVHAAMYDALNGITQQRGEGFASGDQVVVDDADPPVPGASRVAAVAKAAKDTLDGSLDDLADERGIDDDVIDDLATAHQDLFDEHIANDTDGNTDAGIDWGATVAEEIEAARENSGFFAEDAEVDFGDIDRENLEPGQAQLTAGFGNANLGDLDPWVFEDTDALETFRDENGGELLFPPGTTGDRTRAEVLKSVEWAIDYTKTKQLGNTGLRDDDAGEDEPLYPDAPDVGNLVIDRDDAGDLADAGDLYDGATEVLERAVEFIEGRDTEILDPDGDGTFDNEDVRVWDGNEEVEFDDPDDIEFDAVDEVEIVFRRPENFGRLGEFWVALGGTAQPEGRWFQIARVLSRENDLGMTDNATLLKDLALASTEGSILGFNTKVKFADEVSWRPHAAINGAERALPDEYDESSPPPDVSDDDNPLTDTDEEWQTISAHVPSTEHPSGLTLTSTAAQNVLETYFPAFDEDAEGFDADETFAVTVNATAEGLEEPEETTAEFASFEQARRIAMDTREYTGRHYRYSLEASARIGRALADQELLDE